MFNKIIAGAVVVGSLVLAGCSSDSASIEKLDVQVKTLDGKVEDLRQDVVSLSQDAAIAKGEAARANQRLDNQVKLYKK